MKKLKIIAIILSALIILGLIIFVSIQIYIDNYAKPYIVDVNTAPTVDAILVLGAKVYKNGNPSPILADRLDYAYELYVNKKAKKIIVSGDHRTDDYNEVGVMYNYLLKKGVPREDIFLDHAGFDTYDSMYRANKIFEVDSLLISTQHFHIKRAIYIARRMGIEAYGYPSEDKSIYDMTYFNFRETLAKVKAFIEIEITKREPIFLGETIPISGNGTITQ